MTKFLKLEGKDYIQNFYRIKLYDKMNKQYLITTDDGNFLFINDLTLKDLKLGKIKNEETYNNLLKKFIILNESNFKEAILKLNKKYSYLNQATSLHIVIPTYRCNMNCAYCFASAVSNTKENERKFDTNKETAKKILEFIFQTPSNAVTIEFQGGEALLNFEILKYYVVEGKKLNKKFNKDLRFALVSNLTLMTNEKLNWLIDNDVSICTSFDGPKNVHDKNRFILSQKGIKVGTYEMVTNWLKKIYDEYKKRDLLGKRKVQAIPTITNYSLKYWKEIIDEFVKYNIEVYSIRTLTDIGRINENQDYKYDYEKFNQFFLNSINYIKKLIKNGTNITEKTLELYYKKIILNEPTFHTEFESPCGAIIGQLLYDFKGDIYTCNEAIENEEFKIGNVFEDNWNSLFKKKIVEKAILNSMLESNPICDKCVYKPYCSTCMVENYNKFGKFNFYPTKTSKHYLTKSYADFFFNKIYKDIKKELKL